MTHIRVVGKVDDQVWLSHLLEKYRIRAKENDDCPECVAMYEMAHALVEVARGAEVTIKDAITLLTNIDDDLEEVP